MHFEDGWFSSTGRRAAAMKDSNECVHTCRHTHTHTHTHTHLQNRNTSVVFSVRSLLKPPEFPRQSLNYESLSEHIYILARRRFTDAFCQSNNNPQKFLPRKRLLSFSPSDVWSSEYRPQKSTAFTQRLFVLASAETTQTLWYRWGFMFD